MTIRIKSNQKTTVPSQEVLDDKQWYIVDVKGKTLGRVATQIADILRGKGKTYFTPQHDCGDYVVVINATDIRLAGNKMDTKLYRWHTGYPKGFRERTAREIMENKPEQVLFDAVRGMLPRNRLRQDIIKKLRIFPTEAHTHSAQSPKPLEL
ncbi:50S ribosomal protein L13 [Candidatus Peregrinibacteria bacterium CG_4_9_14_0_2_um_filter_53_11]|nr:MAG: 50S ribosomal protein L13 [Candidatus Peregrinibacteria bacterium CG_4_9_14_0_2_um_filter_53_11]